MDTRNEFIEIAKSYGSYSMFCYLDGVGTYTGDMVLTDIDYHLDPDLRLIPHVAVMTLRCLDRRGFNSTLADASGWECADALANAVLDAGKYDDTPFLDNNGVCLDAASLAELLRQRNPAVSRWCRMAELEVTKYLGHLKQGLARKKAIHQLELAGAIGCIRCPPNWRNPNQGICGCSNSPVGYDAVLFETVIDAKTAIGGSVIICPECLSLYGEEALSDAELAKLTALLGHKE